MKKRLPAIVLITAAALTGCRATPPSKLDTKVVTWTKHHITIGGKKDKNPIEASADNIDEGKQAFTSYCMVCHGLDGQNTGVPFRRHSLTAHVPLLSSADVQFRRTRTASLNGLSRMASIPSGMPPSNGDFSDREMWEMVLYIRHLPKAGSLGDPAVYSGAKD